MKLMRGFTFLHGISLILALSACSSQQEATTLKNSAAGMRAMVAVAGGPVITGQPQANTPHTTDTSVQVTYQTDYLYIFMTASSGDGSALSYQWFRNGVAVSGATGTNYWSPSVQANEGGQYYVVVSNAKGSVQSNSVSVEVLGAPNIAPVITAQPLANTPHDTATSVSVTANDDYLYIYMSAQSSTSGALAYQYFRNGVAVGGNSPFYWSQNVQPSEAGDYYVVVTDVSSGVSVTSQSVHVDVTGGAPATQGPTITEQPSGGSYQAGQQFSIRVSATGTGNLSYQWYKNGGAIPGATLGLIYSSSIQASDAGNYYVVVTDDNGSTQSSTVNVAVNGQQSPPPSGGPTITGQPTGGNYQAGQQFSIRVTATGTGNLSYQWYKNGAAISGATMDLIYTASIQASDAGSYYAIVTDSTGSTQSSTVNVTVNGAQNPPPPTGGPRISSQPSGGDYTSGQQFAIQVAASGSGNLSYQWYKDGAAISGANMYLIYSPSIQVADAGHYYVIVTDSTGSTQSSTVAVTVDGVGTPAPSPTPSSTPPGSISPDGTIITAGSGSITSQDGVWTISGNQILLNGSSAAGGLGSKLEIANGGKIYVLGTDNGWWLYSNGGWSQTSAPNPNPSPTPSSTPSPTPTQTQTAGSMLLGACGSCVGLDTSGVTTFENETGRKEDYVLIWGWAQDAGALAESMRVVANFWPSNYHLVWTLPMLPDGAHLTDITNGSLDATFRTAAQNIAARDPNAIIRTGKEFNGEWETYAIGGANPAGGTSAQFAEAFRHIVTIFRSVSQGFKFDWNPGIGEWAGFDPLPAYPGKDYVDYISLDAYEDAGWAANSQTDRWNHFLQMDGRGLDFWSGFAASEGKPMAFDEWASGVDDGFLIQKMHDWMTTHNVAYHMYWDSEAAFSGSFATHPVNGAKFRQLFGDGH